jgi:hypothetical protein
MEKSAAEQIDDIITLYGGWKGDTLSRLRSVVIAADSEMTEDVKWRMRSRPEGLPVWSHDGILCLAETFKDNIKLVFFKGVLLKDPNGLFNARLNSTTDRAIEFHEGDAIDEHAIGEIVAQAVQVNIEKAKR